jgi:hypothetical protein
LLAGKSGEIFASKEMAKTRLQAFALSQGLAGVVGKSHKDRSIFHCIITVQPLATTGTLSLEWWGMKKARL